MPNRERRDRETDKRIAIPGGSVMINVSPRSCRHTGQEREAL